MVLGGCMNELARAVSFSFGLMQNYRVIDRNGNPWFAAKDAAEILEIKFNYRKLIMDFPENEKAHVICAVSSRNGTSGVCDVGSTDATSAKPRARKTQKLLIINEQGLFRLILKSRKPVAQAFKEKLITEILPAYRKHGINWAALPKIWYYRGEMLNYAEWRAKKEAAYFARFPNADTEDFLRSLPVCPPVPGKMKQAVPEAAQKEKSAGIVRQEGNV
jgi:prophage antirepressor-like protein